MKRRDFLRLTAASIALSPVRSFAEGPSSGPEMTALCDYMSAAKTRALPPEVAEHAKHHILDTLASMISGSELPPGQAAQRYIRANATQGAGTVAGTALTASPVEA